MTKKEFEIQKALGLISWYSIAPKYRGYYRNIQAISKDDAIQKYKQIIVIEYSKTEAEMILRSDSFNVRKLCRV